MRATKPTALEKRRAASRDLLTGQVAKTLNAAGFKTELKNNGALLLIFRGNTTIDFWPGTARWKISRGINTHEGVESLLEFLGIKQ